MSPVRWPVPNALLSLLPPQPSQFQLLTLLPGGTLNLVFTGVPGAAYTIEVSTNLTDWSVLTNLAGSALRCILRS